MLELAFARIHETRINGVDLFRQIPDEKFDWINAYSVFQHVDPRRGLPILHKLLDHLRPTSCISLNFSICRNGEPQSLDEIAVRPVGIIEMYDYDLTQIVATLMSYRFRELKLLPACDGDHVGVLIFGFRGA
jgi:hypothetical protein